MKNGCNSPESVIHFATGISFIDLLGTSIRRHIHVGFFSDCGVASQGEDD